MIPQTPAAWTIDAILEILRLRLFEAEEFDFKEMLPDSRDAVGKERLRTACAAFANSGGGFLVFGIADDRDLDPSARLVGLDAAFDFPEYFGNYPRLCIPSVEWTFRNPALALPNGRLVHVVQVPRSWKAPHAVGSTETGWRFPKRTNQGDHGMSIDEVRLMFLSYYEKRLRLQLLRTELETIRETAEVWATNDSAKDAEQYDIMTIDLSVLESVLTDTYPITVSSPELLSALARVRSRARIVNNACRVFFSTVGLPLSNKADVVRAHNAFMRNSAGPILQSCEAATIALTALLA